MNIKNEEDFKNAIKHILESGANEIRIIEMLKRYISKNYPPLMETPKPLRRSIDDIGDGLIRVCEEYINFMDDDDQYYEDKQSDQVHYVFEQALETVYGDNIFEWINARRP